MALKCTISIIFVANILSPIPKDIDKSIIDLTWYMWYNDTFYFIVVFVCLKYYSFLSCTLGLRLCQQKLPQIFLHTYDLLIDIVSIIIGLLSIGAEESMMGASGRILYDHITIIYWYIASPHYHHGTELLPYVRTKHTIKSIWITPNCVILTGAITSSLLDIFVQTHRRSSHKYILSN